MGIIVAYLARETLIGQYTFIYTCQGDADIGIAKRCM